MDPSAQQGDIMGSIQDMIGNLLKNAIENAQRTEMNKHLGGAEPSVEADNEAGAFEPQMDMAEVKMIVKAMQKFLDNVNAMIFQLENGGTEYNPEDDKLLDDYIDTAANIFEIAAFSMKDTTTGVSNRYAYDNRLVLEWNRAVRDKSTLSLLLISIDSLKAYKEIQGQQQVDVLMQAVARTLEQTVKRSTDFIARLDDEYGIILPITDAQGAKIVAERILNAIDALEIPGDVNGQFGSKTACIGVCVHMPAQEEQIADFIAKANETLQQAIAEGPNKIIVS
ncbi:MAG: GGDEF domain-containing protein [Symbiobacteriaceae bacterium]|nr:GGDEF domain-containing protein [Symbiobacteriaceae bacterium]